MTERIIDEELRLIPYYRNDAASLPWYQNLTVCKQVDDRDTPYDVELLHCMYDFLSTHVTSCFFIYLFFCIRGRRPARFAYACRAANYC